MPAVAFSLAYTALERDHMTTSSVLRLWSSVWFLFLNSAAGALRGPRPFCRSFTHKWLQVAVPLNIQYLRFAGLVLAND